MLGIKERITQSKELLGKIQQRRQEVQTAAASQQATRAQAKTQASTQNTGWSNNTSNSSKSYEDLEEKFRRWEMDDELEKLKRSMGK
jgi:phage shock protein A